MNDKLPPHSIEAEREVLGAMIFNSRDNVPIALEKVVPDHFYDLRNRAVFDELSAMSDIGLPIDQVTLGMRVLKNPKLSEAVGGVASISSYPDMCMAGIEYYIEELLEAFTKRKLLQLCYSVGETIYAGSQPTEEILSAFEADALAIRPTQSVAMKSAKELTRRALERYGKAMETKGQVQGIPTSLFELDRMTGGFRGGQMIVLAARPSVGTTTLAMQMAEAAAMNGYPALVNSLEMNDDSIWDRLIAKRSKVSLWNLINGELTQGDMQALQRSTPEIAKLPIHVDDRSELTISQIRAHARRMKLQHGIGIVLIDYLQLIQPVFRKGVSTNREQQVAEISKGLKAMAKELDVPVVVLAQLNRESESDARKPRKSDLRESGSIEQDADIVLLGFNPDEIKKKKGDDDQAPTDVIPVTWILAKQRNGPTGEIKTVFKKSLMTFENGYEPKGGPITDEDCD